MISIDIFVPEHGGDPLSAGKSRAGLRLERVGCDESLGGGKGGKDGWFMVYHGLPFFIPWLTTKNCIESVVFWVYHHFFKKYFDWPIRCPSQKTRDVVECHAKLYPMPGHIWCAALSDFTPACPSMSMKIDGYRIMATYGHQIWGKQGVTVHMSIHIWYLGYLKCDPTG